MPLQTGQVFNNRYRIVKLLGQGGFGAVYRAWDSNLNKPCALKENLDVSPEAQRQFTREATVLANLSHPNLPRVTDHFILPGQGQYLVMDFVEGDDLASILTNADQCPLNRPLPGSCRWQMRSRICTPASHRWSTGISSRQISASPLMGAPCW